MLFNSFNFVVFFIITFAFYYLFSSDYKKQNLILLIASYVFYGIAEWKMIPLLLVSTVVYWLMGKSMTGGGIFIKGLNSNKRNKAIITIGVLLGAGLLLYFKYLNFFIESFAVFFNSLGLQWNAHSFNIVMPLGISFFTFRLMSYPIEIHRGNMEPCRDFVTFASYVAFFPTIMSGPIDRPNRFIPQLSGSRHFCYEKATDGCRQILWGLFLKVIADNIALYVNNYWDSENTVWSFNLILSAIMYSFQLYFDFSGYSNMAIGIAKLLGINVAKNFNTPYFARCISEFWRRWHMSLTSWFTDYVYIPLGGNRKGKARMMLNTIIVFGLCGLWHGANWTFVVWGLYCGITMCIASFNGESKEKWKHTPVKFNFDNVLNIMCVFVVITIGWILFRANSMTQIYSILDSLIHQPLQLGMPSIPIKAIELTAIAMIAEWFQRSKEHPLQLSGKRTALLRLVIYYTLVILILIYGTKNETFIYAQF
jgi:D-alanyl-lipoteichoic acid acyltransferase DltB (MBOAT superfamily)